MLAKILFKYKKVIPYGLVFFRILILFFIFSAPLIYQKFNCEFRVAKIDRPESVNYRFKSHCKEDPILIQLILSQNFTYLSHGAQSYVFVSQNGKYILKLFRKFSFVHPLRKWVRNHILQRKPKLSSFD